MLSHQQTDHTKTSPPESRSRDLGHVDAGIANPLWQSFAFGTAGLQPKLTVSQPDDPYEQEADRIADRVMRMTDEQAASSSSSNIAGSVHRKCPSCEEEEGILQRQVSGQGSNNAQEAPRSHAAEVEALLTPADPVAGVGNPDAAVALIRDLPMASVLLTMRDLRDHFRLDIIRAQINSSPSMRLKAALVAVDSQGQGTSVAPEALAQLREYMPQLNATDQSAITQFLPAAQTPAEPVAPAAGITAPGSAAAAGLPAPLLETLWRSYTRRMAGMPGSRNNIANAFWRGRPADLSQAITALDSGGALTIIREIYSRWTSAGMTWTVHEIHNVWSGGAPGMNFVARSASSLRSDLSSSASGFCRDRDLLGGFYHYWHNETPCWREQVAGSRGLHFCLGSSIPSVHIDPTQVVEFRESDGTCNYDMSVVWQHFRDLGWVP